MLEKRIKRQVIGKDHELFAVVQPGFEEVARRELTDLGIGEVTGVEEGGVSFRGRLPDCYRVNLGARTVTRVLLRLFSVKATNFRELRRKAEALPFELHLADGVAVAFKVKSARSRLYHEGAIEEELRRSLAARLAVHDLAVGFPEEGADQVIHVRVTDDVFQFSLDTSGAPLYLRGRKLHAVPATLRETTAAAILQAAGWPGYDVLLDPMCGAGTFSLEALEMSAGKLPNADRPFPFMEWPAFRPPAFAHLKREMTEAARAATTSPRILAGDADPAAVESARGNLAESGLPLDRVSVELGDFPPTDFPEVPAEARALLVLNPPWGKRLAGRSPRQVYRRIGEELRHHYRGAYAIIVPGLEVEKALSLPREEKILFMNGGLRVAAILHTDGAPGA